MLGYGANLWADPFPRHIGDFTQWQDHDVYQQAFDRLLRDLKADKLLPAHSGNS